MFTGRLVSATRKKWAGFSEFEIWETEAHQFVAVNNGPHCGEFGCYGVTTRVGIFKGLDCIPLDDSGGLVSYKFRGDYRVHLPEYVILEAKRNLGLPVGKRVE